MLITILRQNGLCSLAIIDLSLRKDHYRVDRVEEWIYLLFKEQ